MPLLQRVYAEALLKAAGDSKSKKVYGELMELSAVCAENRELENFLVSPVTSSGVKREVMNKILPSETDVITRNFIFLLMENRRVGFLPEILKSFYRLLPENKNKIFMKIFTAQQLDGKFTEEIKNKYSKLYGGAAVEAEIATDPSLLGGICVQIGDMRYDGSLKTKLKNLKEKLI